MLIFAFERYDKRAGPIPGKTKKNKKMEMEIINTYNRGVQLVNCLATLEYNSIVDCPDFDIHEYSATFNKVCEFIGWCKENRKFADVRYYINYKCSQGYPEWESMREMFKMRGIWS